MRKVTAGLFGRSIVVFTAFALVAATVPAHAESYTVRGPEGNTITVDDDSISGEFEGADYYVDDDSATVNDRSVDDEGGGGGGGGNGVAIAAGLAVVAVIAGVGLWWYFARYKPQHAALAEEDGSHVALYKFNESAVLTVTPTMVQLAGMDTTGLPDPEVIDLASFEVGLRVKF